MELPESLRQLTDSLAKFSAGRMLHLSEVAEMLKVSERYLIDLAVRGKIKAFKIGEHWFMDEQWLDHYRSTMKAIIEEELSGQRSADYHHRGWVKKLGPRKNLNPTVDSTPFFMLTFQSVTAVFALAFIGLSFTLLILTLARVGANRQLLASNFINASYSAYNLPLTYAQRLSSGEIINDEQLTQAVYRLAGQNPPGQVAGAFEEVFHGN